MLENYQQSHGTLSLYPEGYGPAFGARPLKRAIQRELQDQLALKILRGEFDEGDPIARERGPDALTFSVTVPVVEGEAVV